MSDFSSYFLLFKISGAWIDMENNDNDDDKDSDDNNIDDNDNSDADGNWDSYRI